jgi:hypothetical protein
VTDNSRNDVIARLIAPNLVGPMDPYTAAQLVSLVESGAVGHAMHRVIVTAANQGSVSFAELEELLGTDATAPYYPPVPPTPSAALDLRPEFVKDGGDDDG